MTDSYWNYWGKDAKTDAGFQTDFHLLPYHCLDVAACELTSFSPIGIKLYSNMLAHAKQFNYAPAITFTVQNGTTGVVQSSA